MIRRGRREEQETEGLRVHNERDVTINGAQQSQQRLLYLGTNAILMAGYSTLM